MNKFKQAILRAVYPYMTGTNSRATDVDVLGNETLHAEIKCTFKMFGLVEPTYNGELFALIKMAYHEIRAAEFASMENISSLIKKFDQTLDIDPAYAMETTRLLKVLETNVTQSVKRYIADYDIRLVLGNSADYLNVLFSFIAEESDRANAVLTKLSNLILLPQCTIKNGRAVAALPDLVGDRGVEFDKHFKDEFVAISYKFVDDKAPESMVSFSSWTIILELTRTTRQIVITDDSGMTHFKLML